MGIIDSIKNQELGTAGSQVLEKITGKPACDGCKAKAARIDGITRTLAILGFARNSGPRFKRNRTAC